MPGPQTQHRGTVLTYLLRCPGKASCCARVFPDHLITFLLRKVLNYCSVLPPPVPAACSDRGTCCCCCCCRPQRLRSEHSRPPCQGASRRAAVVVESLSKRSRRLAKAISTEKSRRTARPEDYALERRPCLAQRASKARPHRCERSRSYTSLAAIVVVARSGRLTSSSGR